MGQGLRPEISITLGPRTSEAVRQGSARKAFSVTHSWLESCEVGLRVLVCVSRADSPRSAAQGEMCVIKRRVAWSYDAPWPSPPWLGWDQLSRWATQTLFEAGPLTAPAKYS